MSGGMLRNTFFASIVFSMAIGLSQLANAAVISGKMSEPFDYAANTLFPNTGGTPNGGAGWNVTGGGGQPNTSGWGTGALNNGDATGVNRKATAPGLTLTYNAGGLPTGYSPPSGNKLFLDAVTAPTGSQSVARNLGGQTIDAGTTYFSLIMQKDVDTIRTQNWAFFNGTSERMSVGQVGANSGGVTNGSNGNIAVIFQNMNPAGVRASTVPMGVGVPHLIVGRIDWNAAGNETFTMWVDPLNVTTEAAAAPQQTYTGAEFELQALTAVRPFMGNAATNPTLAGNQGSYDEFRIGGSWESVTSSPAVIPEPVSAVMLVLGSITLTAFRKRT